MFIKHNLIEKDDSFSSDLCSDTLKLQRDSSPRLHTNRNEWRSQHQIKYITVCLPCDAFNI